MSNRVFGSDLPPNEDEVGKSVTELLRQEIYRPDELAALIGVPETLIEHDAFSGKLKAIIVNHDIVQIRREDAITWMESRS